MKHLPLETQTLYAELFERLTAFEASRAIGHARGTFVTKTVKGEVYVYFQYLEPGGTKRQLYLGKKDSALEKVVSEYQESRLDAAEERASIERLCALLRVGGALTTDASSARVLRGLADAGVFHVGGVLVGTQAFSVIGNLLGVSWSEPWLRTQDIDIVADTGVTLAFDDADVLTALEQLKMGFLPVPALDARQPSTSFKVRGKALRVDLLVPTARHEPGSPVQVARFKAAAQPLPYLDYVSQGFVRAAVVDGGGVLVNVPSPARFAFHKLIVAGERPAAMHTKRDKDLQQARQLLRVLVDERPGDVRLAWDALAERGEGWITKAIDGLHAVAASEPDVTDDLVRMLDLVM